MRNFKFFHGSEVQTVITAQWTPELAEDVRSYHNIDVESELTNMLSNEIAREIDSNILTQLMEYVGGGIRA